MQSGARAPPACSLLLPVPGWLLTPCKGPGLTLPELEHSFGWACPLPPPSTGSHFRSLLAPGPSQAPSGSSSRERKQALPDLEGHRIRSQVYQVEELGPVSPESLLLVHSYLTELCGCLRLDVMRKTVGPEQDISLEPPSRISVRSSTQAKATQPEEGRSQPLLRDGVPWHLGFAVPPPQPGPRL